MSIALSSETRGALARAISMTILWVSCAREGWSLGPSSERCLRTVPTSQVVVYLGWGGRLLYAPWITQRIKDVWPIGVPAAHSSVELSADRYMLSMRYSFPSWC